jgi:hypothetical protein
MKNHTIVDLEADRHLKIITEKVIDRLGIVREDTAIEIVAEKAIKITETEKDQLCLDPIMKMIKIKLTSKLKCVLSTTE